MAGEWSDHEVLSVCYQIELSIEQLLCSRAKWLKSIPAVNLIAIPHWFRSSRVHEKRVVVRFEGNFREIIWPILAVGQVFGVLPVIGIKSRSISDLHFKWTSLRTFHSLFVVIIITSHTLLLLRKMFSVPAEFSSIAFLIFNISDNVAIVSFFMLASKWPRLMRHWEIVERKLPTFRDQKHKRNTMLRIRSFAFTGFLLALVEYILRTVSILNFVMICRTDKDPTFEFLKEQSPHLFAFSDNIPALVFAKLINTTATFVWNYVDIFIMTISLGLYTQFRLYNVELKRAMGEHKSVDFWIYRRTQYSKLRDLVSAVDKHIAHVNLLSFANLLFFTCKQLFLSIRPLPTYYRMVYYWFSLAFLVLRTFAVSLSAAYINDESKEAIKVLYGVPPYSWNKETKRFFDEVNGYTIALTGMKFFYLTRKMILSLAGVIATYELVLMQFQSNNTPTSICHLAKPTNMTN